MSRTERVTTPSMFIPTGGSMTSLVSARPRVGLSPTSAAHRGRDPDRAGDVVGVGGGHDPRRDGRGRSARRATRRASRAPTGCGSARTAPARSCPSPPSAGVFVRPIGISPAERNRRRQCAVGARPIVEVAQRAHAHVVRLTGLTCLVVLEQERHAGEGAVEWSTSAASAPRSLELAMDHRVECRVQPFGCGRWRRRRARSA